MGSAGAPHFFRNPSRRRPSRERSGKCSKTRPPEKNVNLFRCVPGRLYSRAEMGTLRRGAFLFLGALAASACLTAEDKPALPFRPPEGSVIIDLPSAEVNPAGTLQLVFTHRFSQAV